MTVGDLAANCEFTTIDGGQITVIVRQREAVTVPVNVMCPILASLTVSILGIPTGVPADVFVSSDFVRRWTQETLTGSATLSDLWPATYTVSAGRVTAGAVEYDPEPESQTVQLAEGQAGAATVTYSGGLGTLDVVVSGLPAGVDADVTVTGPGGFNTSLTGSTALAGLAPGNYSVIAAAVSSAGVTWSPDRLSQVVVVVGGQTATANITYSLTARAPIVFEDDFSVGDQWQETVLVATGAATSTVETRATGGVSGGYRHMTHSFASPPSSIAVQHLYLGGSYNPQVDGAIDHINYSEWRIQINPPSPTAAIGTRFLLVQNGVVYTAAVQGANQFTSLVWERAESLQLVPSAFTAPGPDFSAQGGEIFFGFLRSNTTNGVITTTHGIDNWRVEIVRAQN